MLKRLLIPSGILLALLLLLLSGFFYYSSTPSFCRSCHNMEPYYQSWEKSKHNNVSCVTCHLEPGIAGTLRGKYQSSALLVKYLTNTYSPKPFANIKDASCLQKGCHVKTDLVETKPFKGKAAFDHRPHFKKGLQSNLSCTSCHSPLKGEKHISVNESHCYLCHLRHADWEAPKEKKTDKECGVCHKKLPEIVSLGQKNIEHKKFSEQKISCLECHSHVVKGRGTVGESTCFKCHDVPGRRGISKEKMHEIHVVAHIECYLCHDDILHRSDPKAKIAGSDCKSCHLAKHSGVKSLYSGRGGIGVPDRPGPMFRAGVDCIGCHDSPPPSTHKSTFKGKTLKAVKQRCVECHNDERYGNILDQWKFYLKNRLKEVGKKIKEAERKIASHARNSETNRIFQEARYNYYFVEQSPGVHNLGYSKNLLNAAEKKLDMLLGIKSLEKEESRTEEEEVIWFQDTEGLAPVPFKHELHQSMFSCKDCHDKVFSMERGSSDTLGRLTMSNMKRGKYCGHCHNGEDATDVTENCDMCHVKKNE